MRTWLLVGLVILWGIENLAADEAPDEESVVARYTLASGSLPASAPQEHRILWAGILAWVPPELVSQVRELELFGAPENENEYVTDAWAVLGEDGTSFSLGLNLTSARAAFVDREPDSVEAFHQTVVHEFGHVLSLQASQRGSDSVQGTLVLDEGTLKPKAYLNLFFERFWKTAYPGRGPETSGDEEGAVVYQNNPRSFVTEYAATGPLEDFAESFSVFATSPLPSGTAVKDKKVQFFSAFPELVRLRDEFLSRKPH